MVALPSIRPESMASRRVFVSADLVSMIFPSSVINPLAAASSRPSIGYSTSTMRFASRISETDTGMSVMGLII